MNLITTIKIIYILGIIAAYYITRYKFKNRNDWSWTSWVCSAVASLLSVVTLLIYALAELDSLSKPPRWL